MTVVRQSILESITQVSKGLATPAKLKLIR